LDTRAMVSLASILILNIRGMATPIPAGSKIEGGVARCVCLCLCLCVWGRGGRVRDLYQEIMSTAAAGVAGGWERRYRGPRGTETAWNLLFAECSRAKKKSCVSAVFNELSNPCKPCSSRSSLSLAPLLAPLASPLLRLQGPLKPRPCLATSPLWSGRQVVPCLTCVQPVGHPTPLSPSLPSSLLRLSPPACSQGISRFYRETSSKSRS